MLSLAVKVLPPTVTDSVRVSAPAAVVVRALELPSGETVRASIPAGLGALVQTGGESGVGAVSMGLPDASRYSIVELTTGPTVKGNMILVLQLGLSSMAKPFTTNTTRG